MDNNGCYVELGFEDEHTWDEVVNDDKNFLETVFKDGKLVKEYSLAEIRNRMHGRDF